MQNLAEEKDRELGQTWQQLRELQADFRQLQLDTEGQEQKLREAMEVTPFSPSHVRTSCSAYHRRLTSNRCAEGARR